MISRQQMNTIRYIIACINEFASRFNITDKSAFEYLSEHNGISFLENNYEIEHTLGFDDAVDDLIHVCRNNGGRL